MATIKDLKLDPVTGDIAVENGDLVIIEDADVVAQMARLRLRTLKGEWYLDETYGTDYFANVFTRSLPEPQPTSRGLLEATFRDALTSLPHVKSVVRLDFDYDAALRKFTVDFELATDFANVVGSV